VLGSHNSTSIYSCKMSSVVERVCVVGKDSTNGSQGKITSVNMQHPFVCLLLASTDLQQIC